MQVTKNLAEVCTLLVDDIFGELPSRIFAALLNKGRSSIPHLAHYTSLTHRQLRHGLVVLCQNNLLYWDVESGHTVYTANPDAAYNMVRIGKILDMIGNVRGEEEKEVMQNLLGMGHAKVEDLRDAYQAKFEQAARLVSAVDSGDASLDKESSDTQKDSKTGLFVKSLEQLDDVLCRMIEAELVGLVTEKTFCSPEDRFKSVEEEIIRSFFAGGVRGTKGKEDFVSRRSKKLRELRDHHLSLKNSIHPELAKKKRRKTSGWSYVDGDNVPASDLILPGDTVLRINYDKCAVDLRTQQLANIVSEFYGETTAEVYATLLQQLSKKISRCRPDPRIDIDDDPDDPKSTRVSTNEIFDKLDSSLDVSAGIGKVSAKATDRKSANRIYEKPPVTKRALLEEAEVDGGASSDEQDAEDLNGHVRENCGDDVDLNPAVNGVNGVNGTKDSKVQLNDSGPAKLSRKEHFRQHLLLLCEGRYKFLRHCAIEQWTVDFEPLLRSLQELELDTLIQHSVGQNGLRLVRILRQVGKMDEKTLPSLALMPKGEVQRLMLKMQMLGYVDLQEVPRDNNRTVSRTLFLYWTDTSCSLDRLLDNTYKTMVRCLQRLEAQREMEREVLETVGRDDVRGREKELLEGRFYNRFVRITEVQEKLLAHVARLDSIVGTLRDF